MMFGWKMREQDIKQDEELQARKEKVLFLLAMPVENINHDIKTKEKEEKIKAISKRT